MSNRIRWREHWDAEWHALGEEVDVGEGERLRVAIATAPVTCANPACGCVIPPGQLRVDYSAGARTYCLIHGPGEIEVRKDD